MTRQTIHQRQTLHAYRMPIKQSPFRDGMATILALIAIAAVMGYAIVGFLSWGQP